MSRCLPGKINTKNAPFLAPVCKLLIHNKRMQPAAVKTADGVRPAP